MTIAEEARFEETLRAIQEEMREAGGLERWLETRMDAWLLPLRRCPSGPAAHRVSRR